MSTPINPGIGEKCRDTCRDTNLQLRAPGLSNGVDGKLILWAFHIVVCQPYPVAHSNRIPVVHEMCLLLSSHVSCMGLMSTLSLTHCMGRMSTLPHGLPALTLTGATRQEVQASSRELQEGSQQPDCVDIINCRSEHPRECVQ